MKLSAEQIEKIDHFLESRNLYFMDFKIEVKDHMACQIESIMETEKVNFDEAFDKTIENWKFNLAFNLSSINNLQ